MIFNPWLGRSAEFPLSTDDTRFSTPLTSNNRNRNRNPNCWRRDMAGLMKSGLFYEIPFLTSLSVSTPAPP